MAFAVIVITGKESRRRVENEERMKMRGRQTCRGGIQVMDQHRAMDERGERQRQPSGAGPRMMKGGKNGCILKRGRQRREVVEEKSAFGSLSGFFSLLLFFIICTAE